ADASDFEQWVDGRRAALAADGACCIESFAKELADTDRLEHAAEQWRRLALADLLNACYATAYMEARVGPGDGGGAISQGRGYAFRLKEEFDVEPDASVSRLLSRLRDAGDAPPLSVARKPVERPPAPAEAPIAPQPQEPIVAIPPTPAPPGVV